MKKYFVGKSRRLHVTRVQIASVDVACQNTKMNRQRDCYVYSLANGNVIYFAVRILLNSCIISEMSDLLYSNYQDIF